MSNEAKEALFSSYTLGDLRLKNRIVMAPLTRTRADNSGKVPNGLMAEYYASGLGRG
jgi:N-ethylmaleimide reductase